MPGDGDTPQQTEAASSLEFKALQARISELEKELKEKKDKTVVTFRDRKIPTFTSFGDVNVNDWVSTVLCHLDGGAGNRFKDEQEKAAFVFEHLDHAVRTEIRFILGDKTTSGEILNQLILSYGGKVEAIKLQSIFYSRDQKPDESLQDYLLALMEILNEMIAKDMSYKKTKDNMLKFKFSEGVLDTSLKRELKRVVEERSDMSIVDLRHHALSWVASADSTGIVPAISSSTRVGEKFTDFQLHKQVEELTEMVKQLQKQNCQPSVQPTGQPIQDQESYLRCNYCRKPGHKIDDCFKLKAKRRKEETGQGQSQWSQSGNLGASAGRADRQTHP